MKSIKIIAEAGVNHNGSEELAFKLVDEAKKCGADIVKFQTFKAKNLVTQNSQQAEYQKQNTGVEESQLSMLSRLELSYEAHHRLYSYCESQGIEFLSTAFDDESLEFLVNDIGLKRLKIPSGEITNLPLVLAHARKKIDLIVSTGMASLAEIELVLGVIAFGLINENTQQPSIEAFKEAYASDAGKIALQQRVTLLHCTTEYPAPLSDINLKAIDTLANTFNLSVGYSDHSEGITVAIAAAVKNSVVIEKHFTLDKEMEGPDHVASLNPVELSEMVTAIREVETIMGDGIKYPRPSELKNINIVRKSLVASEPIKKGQIFTSENVSIKRPGNGMSPSLFWTLLDSASQKDYEAGELIAEYLCD